MEGKAEKPVYLSIKDGEVSIRDAGALWGLQTKETQAAIREELGDKRVRVAMIGPGGENLVPYACIMNGPFDAAGRGGLGAVMGSKNLKAIAVRGTGRPRVFDREGVKAFNAWLTQKHWEDFWLQQVLPEYGTGGPEMEGMEAIGHLPVHNWRGAPFAEGIKNVHGGALKERMGLSAGGLLRLPAPLQEAAAVRRALLRRPGVRRARVRGHVRRWAPTVEVDDPEAMVKANEICNAYSLDVISVRQHHRRSPWSASRRVC